MKTIIAASIVAIASATGALAQQAPVKVPTGIDVKGSTWYSLDGGQVQQVRSDRCAWFLVPANPDRSWSACSAANASSNGDAAATSGKGLR